MLVWLLKHVGRKVPYSYSCASRDIFGRLKSTLTYECFHAGKETKIEWCEIRWVRRVCQNGDRLPCNCSTNSWIRTEQCSGALSCSESQFFLRQSSGRSGRIEWGFVYSCTFWDEFHVNNCVWMEKQFKHHLAFWTVLATLTFARWRIVAVADRTWNTMFRLQLWSGWETSDHRQRYWSGHHRDSINTRYARPP